MLEQWKPVPSFEDVYEVSNYGNVRSVERTYRSFSISRTLISPISTHSSRLDNLLAKQRVKVYCVETGTTYDSIKAVRDTLSVCDSAIYRSMKTGTPCRKGYTFIRVN